MYQTLPTTLNTKYYQVLTIESNDHNKFLETYEVYLDPEAVLEIEYLYRDDWDDLYNPCPECSGTEFDHIRYEGGHYGQHEKTVILRNDYWDQKGSLYTVCKSCDEVLYKSPAYDLLKAVETGTIRELLDSESDR